MTDELEGTTADPGAPARGELAPGTQLGKYRLERVLGAGGMGVVWRAHDPDLERAVALKVLRGADAGPMLRARLLREARAMARLKHPNVLTVYEVGSDGDRDYIAMELVDGTTLDAWMKIAPPHAEVLAAILAAGRGLAAAHAAGLVHRDFKPHNVLRSRDGRVLVTDFGLARGTGDEAPARPAGSAVTTPAAPGAVGLADTLDATPNRSDGLLDSTLTQPGALVGTPAYMAPEQFAGLPPDPRTDQFAFCVTAWQALTGERPFRGNTIDELRRAATAGIADVRAKLPRAIRAVLARGLAAEPDARWPSLDALLDALERARGLPRRRVALVAPAIGVTGAIVLAVALFGRHREPPRPPPVATSPLACTSPDLAFADAWTAARRTTLEHRLGGGSDFQRIADAVDALRDEWLHAYGAVCASPTGTVAMARLTCLLGERDEVATFARLLDTIPKPAFHRLDLWGVLPRVEACETDSPVSPPLMPEDRRQRDRIVALRAQIASYLLGAPLDFGDHVEELRTAARAIGWKPLEAEIEHARGVSAQLTGSYGEARTAFQRAIELAEQQHDYRLVATSRIALLEVECYDTADPGERDRAKRLIQDARTAVQDAGDDPVLALAIDQLVATIDLGQGRYDAAIGELERERKRLLELHGYRQAAHAAANELEGLVRRGGDGDLETAWQLGTATMQALDHAGQARAGVPVELELIDVAFRRGQLDDAHRLADRDPLELPVHDTLAIAGRVVGADGKPAAGARVVAWRDTLPGDASRLYTRRDFEGDVATTGADGTFALHAPPHGAVIAELGAARSAPAALGAAAGAPLVLALAPTHALTGHVRVAPGKAGGLEANVRVTAGDNVWIDAAPVARDGTFALAGVPAARGALAVERDGHRIVAPAAADHVELVWPEGPMVEVIVRAAPSDDVRVYVLRGTHAPRSRAQLAALAAAASDVVDVPATWIGFANESTLDGPADGLVPMYLPGDLHAVIDDNAPGEATLCATAGLEASAGVACAPVKLPARGGFVTVLGLKQR